MQDESEQQEQQNAKKRKARKKSRASKIANKIGGNILKQAFGKSIVLGKSVDFEQQSNQDQT